jgi:hypothetical protein
VRIRRSRTLVANEVEASRLRRQGAVQEGESRARRSPAPPGVGGSRAAAPTLGGQQVRRVVTLGDGAEWIWNRAAAFFGLPGVEVVEIVDIWHARQHVWKVANAVHGQGKSAAQAWAEPLCEALLEAGAPAVLVALRGLEPADEAAAEAVRLGLDYFGRGLV